VAAGREFVAVISGSTIRGRPTTNQPGTVMIGLTPFWVSLIQNVCSRS